MTLSSSEGPAGSTVTARGEGWELGNRVEVRWNSPTGPLLAEPLILLPGGSFSVEITIPRSATPGVHYVHANHTGAHNGHSPKSAPFTVTRSASGGGSGGSGSGGAAAPGPSGPGGGGSPGSTEPPAAGPGEQPSTKPTSDADGAKRARAERAKAVARCKKRYSAKRARTASSKKRLRKKMAACTKKAKKRFPISRATAFTSPLPRPFL